MSELVHPISLKEMVRALEDFAPSYLAESWDNVGVMVGSMYQKIHKVLCALDLNEAVLQEAIEQKVDCIVTHHPFLFKPIKKLNLDDVQGKIISQLIEHHISVYSMHTNYDIAWGGINDLLARELGLENVNFIEKTYEEPYYKCIIYVPITHYEVVRQTVVTHMTSQIGNYKGCTYTTGEGEGTFIPLEGSMPYIGEKGTLEKVKECQVSFMGTKQEIKSILDAVQNVHPYEEIAVDQFMLTNMCKEYGIGRYGKLKEPIPLDQWIQVLKAYFNIEHVRVTDTSNPVIQSVAICSGAGSDYLAQAAQVADVYVTGDMKFHEGQVARKLGVIVIDVGHYASEQIALRPIGDYIKQRFSSCEVIYSNVNGETLWTK